MEESDELRGTPGPLGTLAAQGNAYPEDTFRIMVATDNHIGYNERDSIRAQDSINTFREILQLAVKHDVDFVLLGGDLFHENRPSRDTLYQVMALLREYCMSDRPIQIELLSDPEEGKAAGYSFPAINYEDPNLNIGMPVFSIHGNHDDPQGTGPEGALCALDMLSVSGLINYIGKSDLFQKEDGKQTQGIAVKPILLRKGNSRLAIYGMGNIKDERMHNELRSNRVKMYMPKDRAEWFNILVLHQNRVAHGPHTFVPEGMFDNSIDFVIWGHEHDCRVEPEEVVGKNYHICQPGSSVATSLAEGESLEKHIALLEVLGKDYRLTPIPLRTVRPFVIDEVCLMDAAEDEGFDLSDTMEIMKYLKTKVNDLIEKANQQWQERNERAKAEGDEELPPMLPLVRLKVDTTGVSEMSNPVRFGQEFQGRIANPRDVLVFHRTRKVNRGGKVTIEKPELSIDDPNLSASEKLNKVRVHTLVKEFLSAQELQLLGETAMSDAIGLFVEKDDIHAIQNHVSRSLGKLLKNVQIKGKNVEIEEDNLDELVEQAREEEEQEYIENRGEEPVQSKGKERARDDSDARSVDSMQMDFEPDGSEVDRDIEPPPKKSAAARGKKAPAKKAPAKKAPAKRGKKKAVSEEEEDDDIQDDDDDDDDDEIQEIEPPPQPAKRTNRAAVLSQTAAKSKRAPPKKAAAGNSKQSTLSFTPAAATRTSRAAATKARKQVAMDLDSDS